MPRPVNFVVREKILSVGQEYVQANGFNACSVQDIAQAANIPKGSFYSYFESKEAFAVEILQAYWAGILESDHLVNGMATTLVEHFDALANYHENNLFVKGCLLGNLALELGGNNAVVRDTLLEIFFEWKKLLLTKIQAEFPNKTETELNQLVDVCISGFEGAVMQAKLLKSNIPFLSFKNIFLKQILK